MTNQRKEASRREKHKQYRLHGLDQKEQKEVTYKNNSDKNQTTFFFFHMKDLDNLKRGWLHNPALSSVVIAIHKS